MDSEQVAADLAKHEAVCAERWKTAFNRFDDIDDNVNEGSGENFFMIINLQFFKKYWQRFKFIFCRD